MESPAEESVYHITVQQSPVGDSGSRLTVDGVELPGPDILMIDDRRQHAVEVRIKAA